MIRWVFYVHPRNFLATEIDVLSKVEAISSTVFGEPSQPNRSDTIFPNSTLSFVASADKS